MNERNPFVPAFEVEQHEDKRYHARLKMSNRMSLTIGNGWPLRSDAVGAIEAMRATDTDTPLRFILKEK